MPSDDKNIIIKNWLKKSVKNFITEIENYIKE